MQRRKKLQVKNRKQTDMQSRFDVLGSYTGVESFDKYEKPVQDADDLWYHLKLNPEKSKSGRNFPAFLIVKIQFG